MDDQIPLSGSLGDLEKLLYPFLPVFVDFPKGSTLVVDTSPFLRGWGGFLVRFDQHRIPPADLAQEIADFLTRCLRVGKLRSPFGVDSLYSRLG
jgi:hypothetical protein